jgi:hypothetical protein
MHPTNVMNKDKNIIGTPWNLNFASTIFHVGDRVSLEKEGEIRCLGFTKSLELPQITNST